MPVYSTDLLGSDFDETDFFRQVSALDQTQRYDFIYDALGLIVEVGQRPMLDDRVRSLLVLDNPFQCSRIQQQVRQAKNLLKAEKWPEWSEMTNAQKMAMTLGLRLEHYVLLIGSIPTGMTQDDVVPFNRFQFPGINAWMRRTQLDEVASISRGVPPSITRPPPKI